MRQPSAGQRRHGCAGHAARGMGWGSRIQAQHAKGESVRHLDGILVIPIVQNLSIAVKWKQEQGSGRQGNTLRTLATHRAQPPPQP